MTEHSGAGEYRGPGVDMPETDPSEREAQRKKKAAKEKFEEAKDRAAETKERVSERVGQTVSTAKRETRKTARAVADKSRRAGGAVYDTVSENLIPTILTATGAAWLVANILRSRSGDGASPDVSYEPPEFATEEAEDRVRDRAKEMTQRARDRSRRTAEKTGEFVRHNPWYVAGAFAAMGALIGLALPETRRENRLYDGMREELRERGAEEEGVQEPPPAV